MWSKQIQMNGDSAYIGMNKMPVFEVTFMKDVQIDHSNLDVLSKQFEQSSSLRENNSFCNKKTHFLDTPLRLPYRQKSILRKYDNEYEFYPSLSSVEGHIMLGLEEETLILEARVRNALILGYSSSTSTSTTNSDVLHVFQELSTRSKRILGYQHATKKKDVLPRYPFRRCSMEHSNNETTTKDCTTRLIDSSSYCNNNIDQEKKFLKENSRFDRTPIIPRRRGSIQ